MSGMLDNRYVRGAVVVLGGVLVMSFDAALIRAVDQPAGVLSLWRGVLICAAMVLAAGVCHVAGVKQRWDNEWAAWGNGLMFGMASVAFVYSIESTSAANTLFIMATMPVWSAVLGRVFLRASIDRPTVLAILASLAGMTVIFASQLSSAAGRGGTAGPAGCRVDERWFRMLLQTPLQPLPHHSGRRCAVRTHRCCPSARGQGS